MNNPFETGCPACTVVPGRVSEGGAPLTLQRFDDSRLVRCSNCGVAFVILDAHECEPPREPWVSPVLEAEPETA